MSLPSLTLGGGIFLIILGVLGFFAMLAKFYTKVEQGKALVRNGWGGTKVAFSGMFVIPIAHRSDTMDISVKRIAIDRNGSEGLICKDNMRADIKVAFFVRVNKTGEDVLKVAQSVGCERASRRDAIQELFEAKFSEALKTVGKQFNFTELYDSRDRFKDEILKVIGTDLNGFVLDDAAIDFLEQTPLEMLNENNILDSEGIKKITSLTAMQITQANQIAREKEMTIKKQNVEAREAILAMERQLTDTENKQKYEVESVKARTEADTKKIQEEERLKAEKAKIAADEEIRVAEENRDRQIIAARKNKERTEAIETERVEKDRMMEATERERIVALAQIEKDKAIEEEKKHIQDVIRERVKVERTVIEEQERMKDTQAFATAEREKKAAIIIAEKTAEESLVVEVKAADAAKKVAELEADQNVYVKVKDAEASRKASELHAEQMVIEAEARQSAAEKEAAAKKFLAEATIAEKAAPGLADVQVAQAQAVLIETKGAAESKAMELKFHAEAQGIDEKGSAEAKILELKYQAEAKGIEQKGTSEARVMQIKFQADAAGIEKKANAMKLLDGVGKDHEEFKLRLAKEKDIQLAEITIRKDIAKHQAEVVAQALKSSKIDIVGGEGQFFEKIINVVSGGKAVDRFVYSSKVLSDMKETFFNSDPEFFQSQLKSFISQFGVKPEDIKNLSISAALMKIVSMSDNPEDKTAIYNLLAMAERSGIADRIINLGSKPARPE